MYRIFIFLLFGISVISGEEWRVDKNEENSVVFHSKTTLLDFKGETDKVDGYIYWEGDSLFEKNGQVFFEVFLASFETGIGKRDQDMREDVLETDKYPVASFKGTVTEWEREEGSVIVTAKGELALHGIKRSIVIGASLDIDDNKITVHSNFSILLKDYSIEAPSLLAFVKVAQEIKIDVMLNLVKANKI